MKTTIKAFTLLMVLSFGASMTNAGIIVGGRPGPSCEKKQMTELVSKAAPGIIVGGRFAVGSFLDAIAGIIVGGRSATSTCEERIGIIVGGRDGIIVGGRGGILVSD